MVILPMDLWLKIAANPTYYKHNIYTVSMSYESTRIVFYKVTTIAVISTMEEVEDRYVADQAGNAYGGYVIVEPFWLVFNKVMSLKFCWCLGIIQKKIP